MVYGSRRLDALGSLLFLVLFCRVFQTTGERVGKCPDLSRKFSQRCPPDTIDQCKYDEDCTENNKQKCCKIGCGKICFNPGDLALISGNSVCPVLPRPNPCPNEPNQCLKRDECVSGKECCSDGCRMICVQPVVVPTKEPAERKTCNAIVDVAFIIDSSGSISRRNYGKIKAFVKGIAGRLGISTNGSRAGIILYSTKASVKAYFNDSRTIEEFKRKVDELPHERGLTYINKALELASSELFSRARKDVPKVAMLLTDGEQSKPESTLNLRDASAPLRQQGVRVIAFGIGKRINVRELRLTVERDEDVIRVMKFDDLVTKVGNYTNSLCEAAVTEPIHPDADIIFLMDSSVGVSREQLILQQQFVRRLARYFIISPLGPRGALVTYDRASFTVIGFSDYGSTADFSLKINDARLRGGSRRIDQALNYATKMFQDTGREGLRIVILLTAGNYYSGPGADTMSSVVMRLRSIDAHLYVIGIGSQFTPSVFTQMVRKPRDIFQVASFHDLEPWQSRIARTLRHTSNAFKYEPADFRSDIIFLMDSSRFVTKENYILEKNYVKLMARLLNLANNRSRAALYAFSDRPSLQITFDGYEDREAFDTAVNSASHLQGARRIDRAFEAAAELLRTRSRSSVPKYVILLTTGRQSQVADMRSLRETSQQIRTYGGRVFVVAILAGGYTVRDFWQAVQRPEDAMSVPSFINLLPRASFMASRIMGTWRAPEAPTFAADIAFILDSSSAVTPFQYTRAQRFVRILSEYLNISPGKSRGSLITVGDSPIVNFNFDGYNTHAEFRTLVTDASYLGGSSSITSALRTAATMFTGARRSYPWLVILVTPWRPRDIRDTRALEAAASPLLKRGIWLYVLSVSENPYVGWLRPVVVEPRDAFSVVSYRDLPANIGSLAGYITADNYLYGGSKFLLDIIFLIDSSSGINSRDYSIEKWFVQRIAMHLGVFQGETVAGVVTYGGNASVVFPLGGYRSNSEFIRRLNDAPSMGGVRQIDRALDTAAALLLRSRSTLPKAVVLITAGDQSTAPGTIPIGEASRPLRQLGAWVYVTAIGRMDARELQKVTIRPTDMFFASSFPGLYGFVRPVGTYVANTSVITGTSSLNADIVFIIDCSSSVPYREYQTQKDFVKSLAQYLNIQPGLSRVALVVYGSRAMPVLRFDSSRTIERFYSELAKTPYLGGPRNVDRALTMVMQRIFVDARENVPKIVLLFMAGKQSGESGSLRDSVRPLHLQGIRTFIFRIGSEPALRELHAAVDLPGDVFEFASFADLDSKTAPYLARHIPYSSAFLGPLSLAVDVVYLIDSSASVTSQHYNDQKTFVKQLSRFLNKMPGRTRVAVITYGSTATVISNFGDTSTTQEFHNALDNAPKVGGPRRMDRAVDKARTALAKARPAVPKVVILLTAGNQQVGIQASILDTSFKQLYNLGARLYAVTISPQIVLLPLRGTAGSDWFPVRNFIDLPRHVVPLSRYVAHDTAALGPYNFVADVIFMLDSSSSVTPDEFLREKEFVKLIARYLNITPGKSRGSVIIFSTEARPILPFDGYTEITGFNSVIDRTPQMSGTRRIDRAFNAAATLFQNSRPSVHRVAILLTGGRQSPDGGSLVDAMQQMKNRDVITYVIAVGGESDVPVQRPQDMFRMASYNDLPRQVQTIASTITAPRVAIVTTPAPTTTPDPCATRSCNAPYSEGCRALNNRAQCICPTCSNVLKPICASDGVQDQSECNMKQQACRGNIWVNVTKEGPCDKECSPLLDIAFIIDSSGSIGRMNWERTKRFVKAVISKLEVSPSAAHVAAISYSTNPRVVLRFNSFQGTLQVNQVFDDMRWERGYTYTDKALLLADSELFQTSYGMRSNVKKIAIVITDGKQTTTSQYTKLSEASRGIKNKGVIVYAIGVGSGVDQAELEEIASGLDYVFTSSSFESLQNEASKIRKSVCEVSKPDPCLTTPCNAPYNLGCKVVDNTAQCICPTCPNILKPVCASDGVEDLSECHLERQACQGNVNVSVAKRTSCDKDCRPIMDIAFIIDSSGSIGSSNWERMKRFLKALVSKLDVSASATHVAAVAYSTNPQVVMTFRNFQGTSQVNQVLDFMRWQRGLTYTDKALQLADRELFQTAKGMRSSVPKVAFVITDGKQTTTGSYTQLSVASQGMKRKGVTVYALGVGSGVDQAELEQIASGSQNVYTSASFKDLKNIAGGIRHRFCRAYVTGPSTTPTPTTPDPCAIGCTVPFNEGCRVVNNTAQCICPTCRNIVLPVCATDGVQDQSDCHMRRQACRGDIGVTVAKQGACDKECRNVVDIAFVIDSSGSIGRKNWERMRRFLKALVSKLDVDSSATHIAAIAYSTKPKVEMKFDGLQSTNQVNRLFDRMLWQRGVTYTDKALLLANKEVFQTSGGMRLHVPKLAIVVTDGNQTKVPSYTRLSVASQGMKDKGVIVYAVGVGRGANRAELEEIASGSQYVLTSSSFQDLQNLAPEMIRRLCEHKLSVSTPTPTTTQLLTTPDPCQTTGCRAPYNFGCRVADNKAECICPTCQNTYRPVCATDGVQDLNECYLRQQACQGDIKGVTVAKQEPCDKECSAVVDIAFVIDSSGSIGRKNWEKMKRFLKALVSKLDVRRSATHIAAVAYSNNAVVVTRFSDIQSTIEVNRKLDGMRWQRGFTYTDKALLLADRDLFQTANGMRWRVPKLAFVITDGNQTTSKPYTKLSVASQGMKNKGVTVYALGVGNKAARAELLEISSGPQYVFSSSSFEELQKLVSLLTREFCEDRLTITTTVPTPPSTTPPLPTTPDPCQTTGCRAPYNRGCRVVENQAECICPLCPDVRKPVCSNDGVQDKSLCNLFQQSCLGNIVAYSVKTGPCDKDCRPLLDIAFIVDSSASIGKTNWERTKRFLKALVSKLDVSPGRTHVAAVAYSTDPIVIMRFKDVQDTDGVNRVLDGMRWQRGLTYTDKALQLADRDILQTSNGMRPNIAKIVILITDGKQTKDGQYTSLLEVSERIKKKGVTMYSIGIGNGVDKNELEEIASSPDKVLTPSSFGELQAIAPQMRKAICQDPEAKYLADVIFLMDASSGTASTYTTEKDLVKSLARYLNIDPKGTRAALIVFNGRPSVISDFESFRSLTEFESKVDEVPHYGGDRSVSDALREAAGMFPKSPSSVSKVIFLVTSGKPLQPQDKNSAGDVINELSAIGVRTYLALVGPSAKIQDFRFLVDKTESVFTVESNGDVPKQVNQVGSYILSESVAPKKLNLSTYVLFVLDSSKQVTPVNFRTQKEFVKSTMSQLNLYPGESDSRVGLMVYSEEATVLLNIDNRESKSALERMVDNLPHLKKGRRIDRALEAATNVLKDVGTDNSKFVILVTAGRQEPDAKSFAAAVKPLHQTGTKTHIFAVGGDVDPSYFQGGDKAKTKIFSVPSFTDLPQKTAMLTEDLLKEYVAPQSTVATTTTAPIQTTPSPTDGDSPSMDIVFILDTSNSVTQSDLEKQKEFVKLMAQRFDVSPFASHAAVLSYGDKTILIGGLYDHVRGKRFEDNVDSVTLIGGKRNIQEALKEATNHLAIFGRQNASNVVFLITYGRQSPELGSQRLQEIVQNVRDTNAILYVIGVGVDADDQQLGLIVESTTDFFEIPRSGDLKLNVPSIVSYTVSRAESKTPEDYKAEVIFVMDSSSLVGQVNYRNQKDFIKSLARALNHSPNYTQSAVIIYDTFPEFAIRMGAYPEIGPFSHTVDKLRYLGGLSGGLDWALRFAPRGFSQDEPDVPKIIVLIATTDSQNPASIDSMSATLRRQDINITILGIGSESNFPNIRRLVARPEDFLTPKASEYLPSYVPTVVSAILSGSANLTTDGGWGPWSEWSKCSRTCGTGLRIRERRCDSPRPQNGGERCQGPSQQLRNCKIEACPVAVITPAPIQTTPRSTVHGGWGPWSGWSRCSRTCGKGSQIQERKCDSPRPQNGGRQCQGLSQQSRECKIRDCPVHGGWSPWDKWSRCTKTCGTGLQTQKRRCDSPRPTSGGRQCEGPSQQTRACSIRSCEDPEGYCPPYSPTKRCLGLVQDECTCDSDCNDVGDYKCCFDGCRRMCRSTAAQVCTASVDIIYLMDSSVSAGDFEKQRDFVRDLARIFSLGASRAAVVTYDDKATARINFDDFDSTFEFANAIDRISQIQTQGGSRIDLALKKTSDMFKSARINVPKVLIALTNGSHTEDSMALNQPVQLLRDQNVRIFAVGIGSNVDINKLKLLVESDADAFLVDLFVDLLRKSQTFADNTCSQISNSTKCVQGVDIAFLMDSSESITDEDFEREKIAVKEIAGLFLSASPDSRVGVIMYSGRPELMVDFLSQNSISEFESAVDDLTHKRSMTRIDSALRFAAQTLFLNPRRSVSSVAVVMTDGIQTPGPGVEPLDTAVLPLREKGVRVLAVGVGPRVDRSELKDLVTSQDDVFLMSSFQDLLNKSAELLEVVCPQPPGAINITTANTTNTTPNTTRATTTSTPIMTTPTTAEPVRCDKLLDVVFVMDSSRSIDEPQYRQEKDFVKRLADIFKIGAGSRAAVIIYSDETQLEITFDQYSNLSSFLSAVESLPYLQRRTRIDKALTVTAQVLEQARPGFPKVVIVMTDGRQTRDPDALDLNVAAKPIHDQGVRVLVVGIGPEISDDELRLIARDSSYVFKVETFENLKKATQDVASTACINPTVTQAPKPKPGTCPFYPIRIRCAVTTNACLTDNECPGNLKCCYDNCRSICTLPDYEETTTPSFIGYCPAPTNPPDGVCPSGRSSCYADDDCSSGYKCCLDGCGFSCQPAVDEPTTAPPPQCSESFDLVFAMDSSGSIGKDNYQKEKNFINGLANKLVVGPRNVHLGLIVFSDSSIVWLNFGTPTSTNYSSFSEAAVDNAPYLRGRTRIDSALQTAGDVFPEGRQNQEPQVLILITDGRQSNDPGSVPLKTAVQPLRDQGVKIIIVGIGEDVDEIELKSIVENADDELFLVGSFLELEPLMRNKKLNDAICLQTIGGRRQRNFS